MPDAASDESAAVTAETLIELADLQNQVSFKGGPLMKFGMFCTELMRRAKAFNLVSSVRCKACQIDGQTETNQIQHLLLLQLLQ